MTNEDHSEFVAEIAASAMSKFPKGDPMALYTLVSGAGTIAITQMPPALAAKLVRDIAEMVAQMIEERFLPQKGRAVQ